MLSFIAFFTFNKVVGFVLVGGWGLVDVAVTATTADATALTLT